MLSVIYYVSDLLQKKTVDGYHDNSPKNQLTKIKIGQLIQIVGQLTQNFGQLTKLFWTTHQKFWDN